MKTNTDKTNVLILIPSIANKIGVNESIVLAQIHYWISLASNNNVKEGKNWVYNTYKSWTKQFPFWSEITIRRIIKTLERSELIISKSFNKHLGNKTKWYTVDYKKTKELDLQFSFNSSIKNKVFNDDIKRIKIQNHSMKFDNCKHQQEQLDEPIRSTRTNQLIKMIDSNITKNTTENNISHIDKKLSTESDKNQKYLRDYYLNNSNFRITNTASKVEDELRTENSKSINKSYLNKEKVKKGKYIENQNNQSQNLDFKKEKQAISIWNEVIRLNKDGYKPNSERLQTLKRILEDEFDGCIEKWKEYCTRITTSKFLMGESKLSSFKAAFDWSIKLDIIEKIKLGEYGIGDRKIDTYQAKNLSKQDACDIETIADPMWRKVRTLLKKKHGINTSMNWFSKIQLVECVNNQVYITAASGFIKSWIETYYRSDIVDAFNTVGIQINSLYITANTGKFFDVDKKKIA